MGVTMNEAAFSSHNQIMNLHFTSVPPVVDVNLSVVSWTFPPSESHATAVSDPMHKWNTHRDTSDGLFDSNGSWFRIRFLKFHSSTQRVVKVVPRV